jgi:hypothetical protein
VRMTFFYTLYSLQGHTTGTCCVTNSVRNNLVRCLVLMVVEGTINQL